MAAGLLRFVYAAVTRILFFQDKMRNMKRKIKNTQLALLILSAILIVTSSSLATNKLFTGSALADVSVTPSVTTTPTTTQKTLTYRTSTSASGEFNGTGLSVKLPSSIQTGDLLIAVAGTNGPKASWSIPSGWTLGTNSNSTDTQGITWWWKVADGSDAGKTILLKSSKYADGGVVVNVYSGQASNPIAGVSQFTTTDNYGNGYVSSANVSGVSVGDATAAVPLIFVSWQPNAATITWPSEFAFESTASDGYSSVAVAENLSSQTSSSFSGYSLPISPVEAVVQTLQVLVRIEQ